MSTTPTITLLDKVRERVVQRHRELNRAHMDLEVEDIMEILASIETEEWEAGKRWVDN